MAAKILLVDDSKVARMAARRLIQAALPDATILDTGTLDEVFPLVAEHGFDLVLLDYNMPIEDGLSLGGRLKDAFPQQRLALLTANIQDAVIQRAHGLGLLFLSKPLKPEALLAALA